MNVTKLTLILAGLLVGHTIQAENLTAPVSTKSTLVFFVDPAAGNDAADGLSPKTAWKTWGQFQAKARPGSSLLLKRGYTYSLPLPLVGGTADAPVVYGAYGEGPKPVLESRLVDLSIPDAWIEDGSGIWRTKNPMPEVANVILDDTTCGNMRYEKALLKNPGEWFDGKGTLFVFSSGNPAKVWKKVELVPEGTGVLIGMEFSHIRFENLSFQKIGTNGIQTNPGAADVTIRRCNFRLIGGAIFPDDIMPRAYGGERFIKRRVRYGNAIQTWQDAAGIVVEACRISDIFDGGVNFQGVAGSIVKNVVVRNNVIWNCGYDCFDIAHGVTTVNVLFEHNTCWNGGEGWALQGEPRPRYSLNEPDQIGYLCNLENGFGWSDKCAVTIRSNIFCNAPESRCFNFGRKPLGNVDLVKVDHNCYFQANPTDAVVQLGTNRFTAAQFDDYRKVYGWDQNSVLGDPLFVNPMAGDFRLKPNSSGSGFGAQLGLRSEQDEIRISRQYDAERRDFTIGEMSAFVILPTKPAVDGMKPWLWYAPTFVNLPDASHEWMFKQLLDRGFAIAGIDVGESYGNPEGRAAFTKLFEYLVANYGLARKACLLPQSRGGLMLYNWAAENPDKVQCIGGIYTVCDMASYPGLGRACGAYKIPETKLRETLAENNPIDRLGPMANAKIPILHVHGDNDTVVPLERNSGELIKRYQALGGPAKLIVIPGKGHQVCPEFFRCQPLVDFFIRYGSN